MSLTRFAEGLSEGVNTGIKLGKAYNLGRNVRGVRQANDVLTEMQNMAPTPYQTAAIPDGAGAGGAPATGYDGNDWNSMKTRYTDAMKGVSDPAILDAMMDRMADLEKGKVMEYGRMALASLKSGDNEAAQNYLAGVSYFTDPGNKPQVQVTPDGTTLMSSPDGGVMAMKPDQLEDFLHQVVDFEGYRDLAFDKEKHGDMMDYREQVRLDAVANDAAKLEMDERRLSGQEERWDNQTRLDELRVNSGVAVDEANIKRLQQEHDLAEKNFAAGASKAKREAAKEVVDGANSYLDSYLEDDGQFKAGGKEEDSVLAAALAEIQTKQESGSALSEEEQQLLNDSKTRKKFLDTGTDEAVANTRNRQALIRKARSNPQTEMDLQIMIGGLAGGQNDNMSGEQAAAISLYSLMGSTYEPFFDKERGVLVIMNPDGKADYYGVAASHHGSFARMFDPLPQEQEAAAPAGAPPAPGPNDGAIPAPPGGG